MVNTMPQLLYPQGQDPVPIVQEAGWTTGTVWTQVQNLNPTRIWFLDLPAHNESLYCNDHDAFSSAHYSIPTCCLYISQHIVSAHAW